MGFATGANAVGATFEMLGGGTFGAGNVDVRGPRETTVGDVDADAADVDDDVVVFGRVKR